MSNRRTETAGSLNAVPVIVGLASLAGDAGEEPVTAGLASSVKLIGVHAENAAVGSGPATLAACCVVEPSATGTVNWKPPPAAMPVVCAAGAVQLLPVKSWAMPFAMPVPPIVRFTA